MGSGWNVKVAVSLSRCSHVLHYAEIETQKLIMDLLIKDSRQRSCLGRRSIRKKWMAKTKQEVSEEFKSDVYGHYQNSVSLYMLLRTEAEKVKREIKINAEEHDPKRMRRDLHQLLELGVNRIVSCPQSFAKSGRNLLVPPERLRTQLSFKARGSLQREPPHARGHGVLCDCVGLRRTPLPL